MIDGKTYWSRFSSINMQFDFAMRALDGFKGSDEAVENYLTDEMHSLRKMLGEVSKDRGVDPSKHWAFSEDGSKKFLDSVKTGLPTRLEEVVNRIRQNKLILMVTLLEAFLKDIHREVLIQNPSLLRADRQIPLGKLVTQPFTQIISEEIEREVQSLDRQSLKQRAEYFDKRLNISWFDGKIVPLVEPITELRNTILHENPDTPVSESDLELALVVCAALPMGCVMQAAVIYPKGFKWGDTNLDGIKAIMEKQGRLKPNPGEQPTPEGGRE